MADVTVAGGNLPCFVEKKERCPVPVSVECGIYLLEILIFKSSGFCTRISNNFNELIHANESNYIEKMHSMHCTRTF